MNQVKLRVAESTVKQIDQIIFSRYPDKEWGTLFRFGFHADKIGRLLLTITSVVNPEPGDMNNEVENVQFLEPYLLRAALLANDDNLGLGVIHSHPEGCGVRPSKVDDQMDSYLKGYFGDFAPDRPYASLIFSKDENGKLLLSGRVYWRSEWHPIESTIVGKTLQRHFVSDTLKPVPKMIQQRLERLTSSMGEHAAIRLWNSTAVVLGVGGTGSAAAHSLARSCVGRIVLIDTDVIASANSERVHGCEQTDLNQILKPAKVEILKKLIHRINPAIEVIIIKANFLQEGVYDELIHADILLGCTDTHHGRGGLSELAYLYLCPALQVNVVLESDKNVLSGQIIQFTRYRPGQPCAYCRDQVDTAKLAQEFMSDDEKSRRKASAASANDRGESGDPYWLDEQIIPTVGALTTIAGELAADFAVGMLTDAFSPPSDFLEMNLLAQDFGVMSVNLEPSKTCTCSTQQGFGDQTTSGRIHIPASHWLPPEWL